MAKHLEKEINKLKKKILSLSTVVEESVDQAVRSVKSRDGGLARQVIDGDEVIDNMEVEVEEECLKILALYQPVAVDLRYVIAVLKINNDLERIGDLSVNIAERAMYLSKGKTIDMPFDFEDMARKTRDMLKGALSALINLSTGEAGAVCAADDEVDAINKEVYKRVYEEIRKSPDYVEMLIHCLSISKHLERIADYATNIAEDVIYMIDGDIVRHKPEEY